MNHKGGIRQTAVDEIMHVKLHNDLPRASENLWQLGAFSKGELYLSQHLPGTSSHLRPHNSDYMGLYIVCLKSDSPPSRCMRPSRMIYLEYCFVVTRLVPRGAGTTVHTIQPRTHTPVYSVILIEATYIGCICV